MASGRWTGTELLAAGGVLEPQGPAARAAEDLWWLMLLLGVAVFVLFAALLGAGLFRSRRDEPDGDGDAGDGTGTDGDDQRLVRRWIIAGGVVLPAVLIAVVFGATLAAMDDTPTAAPDDALAVEVVGHQFWYEVRYPDADIVTANELHLPVGRPIELRLTSADVIHSFWVPALGGKMDLLPDRVNTLVLQADEPGEHVSRCAEFCGLSHANMEMVVVAEDAGDFETWLDEVRRSEPTGGQASLGREVFASAGCVSCHGRPYGDDGDGDTLEGPDLTTLADRATLGAGRTANTRENAADWIRDPEGMKPGVDMPPSDLDDRRMDALLDYLGYHR
ncbi:MAG: cytochrome c oxidase subunit II [Actinobacteria bacterium]|nr:cytochrome c oxidase subunit II [Actinomycetota bacterium]